MPPSASKRVYFVWWVGWNERSAIAGNHWTGLRHCRGFTITLTHTTLSRAPLDEWSVRRRGLYLTTHNSHKRQTSLSPAGFEPAFPTSEWPQTPRPPGLAETFFIKYKTFADVAECFAMYVTCGIVNFKTNLDPSTRTVAQNEAVGPSF